MHFLDVGIGGDGLRGPVAVVSNPYRIFVVHTDAPEIYGPDGLLVDGKYLYVTEKGANNVGIYDLDIRQAVKRVNVGFAPRRLLKRHNTLYVANFRSNSVSLVLMQQQRMARTIPVGRGPLEMAASDRSKWLYVAAQESGVVSVIDQTSNRLNTTIELGAMPSDVLVVD